MNPHAGLPAHLKGPAVSERRLGAHPALHRRDVDAAVVKQVLATGPAGLTTLAPEISAVWLSSTSS